MLWIVAWLLTSQKEILCRGKLTANYHLSLHCHPNLILLFILPLYYHAGSHAGWYTQDLWWMQPPTDKKNCVNCIITDMVCDVNTHNQCFTWLDSLVCLMHVCVCLWKDKLVYNTCKIGQVCEKFWGFLLHICLLVCSVWWTQIQSRDWQWWRLLMEWV